MAAPDVPFRFSKTADRAICQLAPPHSRPRTQEFAGLRRGTETHAMTQGAASTTPGNLSEDQVRLRLQGLQHEVEWSATLARWLGWLALLLVALLVLLVVSIYLYYVMQYASVSSVEASAVAGRPGVAEIVYSPQSAGKIEFVRESEGLVQTLTEYAQDPAAGKPEGKFTWSGKEKEKSTLHVTYRAGLFLVTKDLTLSRALSKE